MTFTPMSDKKETIFNTAMTFTPMSETIFNTATSLLMLSSCSIRFLAKFIGQVVASFPGVKSGPRWYRNLENDTNEGSVPLV